MRCPRTCHGTGRQRIAHLSAGKRGAPACERREGDPQALTAACLPMHPGLIIGISLEPTDAKVSTKALLESVTPPTAIFAVDDPMATAATT